MTKKLTKRIRLLLECEDSDSIYVRLSAIIYLTPSKLTSPEYFCELRIDANHQMSQRFGHGGIRLPSRSLTMTNDGQRQYIDGRASLQALLCGAERRHAGHWYGAGSSAHSQDSRILVGLVHHYRFRSDLPW